MGFREPTLEFDVLQASGVGYSPGSRMEGVSSKKGFGYSSHLGRGREAAVSQMLRDIDWRMEGKV